MEDTTRLTYEQSIKLFIQRDYSEGTAVKFRENFPRELTDKIDERKFVEILQNINRIFQKAESISCRTFTENCCACLTGYLTLLCIPTHYQRCVNEAARYIDEQNKQTLNPRGIFMVDPMEKGLRCIEVCITQGRR